MQRHVWDKLRSKGISRLLPNPELTPVVDWAAHASATREAVETGFRVCGIVPYRPEALKANWQRRAKNVRGENFELVPMKRVLVSMDPKTGRVASPDKIRKVSRPQIEVIRG